MAIAALQAGLEIDTLSPACHIKHLAVVSCVLIQWHSTLPRARETPLLGAHVRILPLYGGHAGVQQGTFRRRYGATQVANHSSLAY